jgi:hypothetical protein
VKTMMEQGKPVSGRCARPYPIMVTPHKGGKRARCLGCGVTMEELDPKIPALLRI